MKIFTRILKKIEFNFFKMLKIYSIKVSDQNDIYLTLSLDRAAGLQKLNEALENTFNCSYDENEGMFSEHLILLSSISIKRPEISSILEIGTFDGKTSLLLSNLFPGSKILTIDLPDSSNDFIDTYGRSKSASSFANKRNRVLSLSPNITFQSINSVALVNSNETFDLIWVDGAHGYPVVAMDIINSFRLVNEGGYVLSDDIWTSVRSSDEWYTSIGGFESLKALKNAGLISSFSLIPKRLASEYNYPNAKKYVGFFTRPAKSDL